MVLVHLLFLSMVTLGGELSPAVQVVAVHGGAVRVVAIRAAAAVAMPEEGGQRRRRRPADPPLARAAGECRRRHRQV